MCMVKVFCTKSNYIRTKRHKTIINNNINTKEKYIEKNKQKNSNVCRGVATGGHILVRDLHERGE
jgi:hypothetical protein